MMNKQWMPRIARALCNGCGLCIAACPTGALDEVDGKAALVQPDACTYCSACEEICPTDAIALPFQIVFSQDYPDSHHEGH